MPSRIDPPVGREELERLYSEFTSTELAEQFGVNKSQVLNWLRRAGIPRRKYSPYTENKIPCPFSPDRLHELYWVEEMSLSEICAVAGEICGRKVEQMVLQRWMDEFGIKPRTYKEAQRVRAKKHPEQFEKCIAHAQAALAENPELRITRPGGAEKHVLRKAIKAAAKAKHEAALETRKCAWCGAEVTRIRANFRYPPERTHCSRSCSNRARIYQKRQED